MDKSLKVRNVREQDAALLRRMAAACPPLDLHTPYTYWVNAKYFGEYSFLVCEGEKIIGYIMCIKNDKQLLIWQIGILKEYRKKNISKILIENVLKKAAENALSVNVSIAAENRDSYGAFKSYCDSSSYIMNAVGEVKLTIDEDPDFIEQEVLYEIKPLG